MSLLLGIDLGTSFIKVAVINNATGECLETVQYPEQEATIISKEPGWAEQDPETWWEHICIVIKIANISGKYNPQEIAAIGIAYQMHGLVVIDKCRRALRPSIIWCDSRATDTRKYPAGNFTAGKLAWVKEYEPEIYQRTDKAILPGDYIALKFSGELTTTPSALSEGMFWNLEKDKLNRAVFSFHDFDKSMIPPVRDVFDIHGNLQKEIAESLGLNAYIPVSYKAGDQLNNALSLNVFEPGEVAATAGTSGVIYAVTDHLLMNMETRVNSFVHVSNEKKNRRLGNLLCINGCGSAYSWIRKQLAPDLSYDQMNAIATSSPIGSQGLQFFPFGNGAERMLENKNIQAFFQGLDFNRHSLAHMIRAVQEGIAFAFRYGLDIMRENMIHPRVIRAARANLFLSDIFTKTFSGVTDTPVELYETSGAVGAAIGAGIGADILSREKAFENLRPTQCIKPVNYQIYNDYYELWKQSLISRL